MKNPPPRVLIADDHQAIRELLKKFKDHTEVVGEAANGSEAIELAEKLQPDLILMDISMPVMNGFEAFRVIKQRAPEIRIILVSVNAEKQYVDEAFRLGAQGFVVKRAAAAELEEAIGVVLSGGVFRSRNANGGSS